ncbi:MAG: tryptophan--tRNA ligase [Patescibacteria group bacterium]|nr:MAG: tryptophan--tRNA ligase [Patescibacteria group bacterium]
MKIVFSGIQPSGDLHIGNYIGAIKQWLELQKKPDHKLIFSVVDLHAITVYQEPEVLSKKIFEIAAIYLSCGVDPKKSIVFVQSANPDHTYCAWVLNCVTNFGWLTRMTQFKDKARKQGEAKTTAGLFNYPVLMAADILLYDTDLVPVGDDQVQHVELTRDIAKKFNQTYKPIFKLPKVLVKKDSARIMSLQDPLSKMSKSDPDARSRINLIDDDDAVAEKIKKAVTDSGAEIVFDPKSKPAISNLLSIYSELADKPISKLEELYRGKTYSQFKSDLTEVVLSIIRPIREAYFEYCNNKDYLAYVLNSGLEKAIEISNNKVSQINSAVGLGL